MIYFDNTKILITANYYVQQLFSQNQGDTFLATSITPATTSTNLAISCVLDSQSGDVILKVVNTSDVSESLRVQLSGAHHLASQGIKTVLTGDLAAANSFEHPALIEPETSPIKVVSAFDCSTPAHSLMLIRLNCK